MASNIARGTATESERSAVRHSTLTPLMPDRVTVTKEPETSAADVGGPHEHVQAAASVFYLTGATAYFHTNNEDKDHDTGVYGSIILPPWLTVAYFDIPQNANTHWNDNSDHEWPFILRSTTATESLIQTAIATLYIEPNGHDTWRFNYLLVMEFTDQTSGDKKYYNCRWNRLQLSQDDPGWSGKISLALS